MYTTGEGKCQEFFVKPAYFFSTKNDQTVKSAEHGTGKNSIHHILRHFFRRKTICRFWPRTAIPGWKILYNLACRTTACRLKMQVSRCKKNGIILNEMTPVSGAPEQFKSEPVFKSAWGERERGRESPFAIERSGSTRAEGAAPETGHPFGCPVSGAREET